MKLISVSVSDKPDKKYKAIFDNNGRTKTTHFGQKTADDYTITKDKEQRERYRTRHAKDLETHDVTRAGYLSYHLLWGSSSNLQKNIAEYRRRFNL